MKSLRELGYVFEIYFYEYGSFSDLDSSDFNAPGILVRGGLFSKLILWIPGMLTQESTLLFGIRSIWVGYSYTLYLFS